MISEILGITFLNLALMVYVIHTFHIAFYGVGMVFLIALIVTALVMYEKIKARLLKYGNATALSISLVIAIAAMIFLQFSLYHYSIGLGLFTAVIAGLETYFIRNAMGI